MKPICCEGQKPFRTSVMLLKMFYLDAGDSGCTERRKLLRLKILTPIRLSQNGNCIYLKMYSLRNITS